MLSYKEYKLLNESLYGAFNLGLRSHGTVGGIVSGSSVNGTEAALEAEAEEAIEEGKKAKKMKKKMDGEEMDLDDKDEDLDDKKISADDSDDDEDEGDEEDEGDDEDSEDSEDEDEGEEEVEDRKKEFAFMKKKMKKGSKKEWSDVISDLEEILEVIDDEEALTEVKKGLEMMKKGMKKGMDGGCKKCGKYMSEGKNHHKSDCDCPVCEKKKDHEDGDEGGEGLTAAQKKLPKSLQDAILSKKGKKKDDDKEEKGDKKCGKSMKEDDAAWWKSVNSMLGTTEQKNWDGGWTEVGEVKQAVRE